MNTAIRARLSIAILLSAAATAAIPLGARADALPGETLKFQQAPLIGQANNPFPGHDEISTAVATQFDNQRNPIAWGGTFMADDFADKLTSPIVHLSWWGSYQQNFTGEFGGVQRFLISFESDVPAVPGQAPSHPGQPLLNQIVTKGALAPGSGTFTETPVTSPTSGEAVYKYNAELNLGSQFAEKANTVYWLKIVALVDPSGGNVQWGWHDRDWSTPDPLASTAPAVSPGESLVGSVPFGAGTLPVYHFQDDAVQGGLTVTLAAAGGSPVVQQTGFAPQNYLPGIDGPDLIGQFSKDLAFELYTSGIPEPGSLMLLGIGLVALLRPNRLARRSATIA